MEDVARSVAALDPDHVGISATTISITNAGSIAALLKERVPRATVTVGGPHVSAVPERTLDLFPGFDYGIVGEGERSYLDLIARLASGAAPQPVAGLVHRTASGVRVNPRAPYLDGDDLDRLPPPAWDLLPEFPLRFQPNVFNYRHTPVASVVVRGCPFSCTRWRQPHVRPARPGFTASSTSWRFAGSSPISACGTSCSTTTSSPSAGGACRRAVRALHRGGLPLHVSCNSHPNLLDLDTLRLMRRAGAGRSPTDRVGVAARARRREARGEAAAHARDAAR